MARRLHIVTDGNPMGPNTTLTDENGAPYVFVTGFDLEIAMHVDRKTGAAVREYVQVEEGRYTEHHETRTRNYRIVSLNAVLEEVE